MTVDGLSRPDPALLEPSGQGAAVPRARYVWLGDDLTVPSFATAHSSSV